MNVYEFSAFEKKKSVNKGMKASGKEFHAVLFFVCSGKIVLKIQTTR